MITPSFPSVQRSDSFTVRPELGPKGPLTAFLCRARRTPHPAPTALRAVSLPCALALLLILNAEAQEPGQTKTQEEPAPAALAQEKPDRTSGKRWRFILAPYGWFAGLKGSTTTNGQKVSNDVGFGDLVDSLDFAGMAYVEATNKNGAYFFFEETAVFLSAGDSVSFPVPGQPTLTTENDLDMELSLIVAEGGVGYRFFEEAWHTDKREREGNASAMDDDSEEDRRTLWLDGYTGLRYFAVDTDLEVDTTIFGTPPGGEPAPVSSTSTNVKETEEWVDPFVGLRTGIQVFRRLSARASGDIGGFDVGSDFAWKARTYLAYDITDCLTVAAGYQWLDVDYDNGEGGNDKFRFDEQLHGPILGLIYRF